MAKTIGYGSVLIVATSTAGEVNVSQIRSISGPGVTGNDVDTTTMDSSSNYRTFVAGLLDPGEMTFSLVYDSTDASHSRLARYMGSRYSTTWKVCQGSSGGTATSFTGYIKGMSREVPMDDVITCDVTLKVSGIPGFTT
jgi:hypothetical protein